MLAVGPDNDDQNLGLASVDDVDRASCPHKAQHAVDLETGVIVAVTVQGARARTRRGWASGRILVGGAGGAGTRVSQSPANTWTTRPSMTRCRGVPFSAGTGGWNRIEHRFFSHIAMNWRGTPLVGLAAIVSLIGPTHSRAGLRVRSELDRRRHPDGVTD
ncbi:MAG: ISAzo13-like element transposase-related protein [Vicinamibacterales bacterium]